MTGFSLRRFFGVVLLTLLSSLFARPQTAIPQDKVWDIGNLAPTPMMGWANWNRFFCDYDDAVIRKQADALVSTGMRDVGYKYVVIQECIAPGRDAKGELILDAKKFPNGMKPLVDYIHHLGLKAGIYTDVGKRTCFPKTSYEGSFGHEQQDANTFAAWGIDFVEMDYCFRETSVTGRAVYERMAKAIKNTGHPMVFYLCSWGNEEPWEWAQGHAQGWRTENDISFKQNQANWGRMVHNFEVNGTHSVMSAPESWNDADMLEVGNLGITDDEAQTHMSMWAISPSVLLAGADLTTMSERTRQTYTNKEVIAINQDPLGAGAEMVSELAPGVEVWAKPLGSRTSGNYAVLLLNTTVKPAAMNVAWSQMDLMPSPKLRDIWLHNDLASSVNGYHATVPAHGAVLLRVSGKRAWKHGVIYEAEWPGVARAGAASLMVCAECSQGYAIGLGGDAARGALHFNGISIVSPGTYVLRLFFTRNGTETKNIQVSVNGTTTDIKAERQTWGWVDIATPLLHGENNVVVSYEGQNKFFVDKLSILRQDAVQDGSQKPQADPLPSAE